MRDKNILFWQRKNERTTTNLANKWRSSIISRGNDSAQSLNYYKNCGQIEPNNNSSILLKSMYGKKCMHNRFETLLSFDYLCKAQHSMPTFFFPYLSFCIIWWNCCHDQFFGLFCCVDSFFDIFCNVFLFC